MIVRNTRTVACHDQLVSRRRSSMPALLPMTAPLPIAVALSADAARLDRRRVAVGLLLAVVASCLALTLLALTQTQSRAAEPAAKVSYYSQIRPIFQANCNGCHQPAKAKGEYVMTTFDKLLKGGESGDAAIVPGQPDKSYLV
ncbi:MAG TPA: hypothetical protein PLV92_20070, partial [Pirellulaceae bacterium]|nr:hypothetical protein [Pirellulaceae bacterium]